jgi:hypothetical protein
MLILHSLLSELKEEFISSRTSNLLRVLRTLFGYTEIGKKRYYTFIASPKLPWDTLWPRLWEMIPDPETGGRLRSDSKN